MLRRSHSDDGDSIRGSFGFANSQNVDSKNVYGPIKSLVYYTLNMAIHVPSRTRQLRMCMRNHNRFYNHLIFLHER